MKYREHLTGVMLIKDGNTLGYPWKIALENLLAVCDTVELAVGDGDDGTFEEANLIAKKYDPQLRIHLREWNMSNTGDGSELAVRINEILPFVSGTWVLYLQADEILHERDHNTVREFVDRMPGHISQVELERTYFWQDLETRIPCLELPLGRIFRTGTHVVGGDGMHLVRSSGQVAQTNIPIYHYSRIGTEEAVNKRIRNLDQLFHPPEEIETFTNFSYKDIGESEKQVYNDTHPEGISLFYKDRT